MHHINKETLEHFFSKSRLDKFLLMSGGRSFDDCLDLYLLNIKYSEKLHTIFSQFEIILRNAINLQMIKNYGNFWFLNQKLFSQPDSAALIATRLPLEEKGKLVNSCNITANLTLGFWVNLFNPAYDRTLWRSTLAQIFSANNKIPARSLVREHLKNFNRLRNRISHCEPIISHKLEDYYLQLIETISWINREIAKWLNNECAFSFLSPKSETRLQL